MRKRGQDNLITGLDIGSSVTRMVVGKLVAGTEGGQGTELQILGAADVPSEGVNRGVINSIEDVVSSISACLERAERMVGAPIDTAWVGISGLHVISQASKGVVAVSKTDSEITEEDVTRAIEASRTIATPLNYEVLHVLPKSFSVDGQTGIRDPIGMTGIRLEVDTQIILGSILYIKNLTKAVYRAGLDIEDLVLSIIATAEAVVTVRQKELGVVVVNMGAATVSLAVFEEGDLLHAAVIPLGSQHITNDIAVGLRTSIDIAEAVKIAQGDCFAADVSKREEIDLYEFGATEHEMIRKQYLGEIIQARVEEILQKINSELRRAGREGLLPAGIVFTGAGAKLPGLVDLAKKVLRLPASLGYPLNMMSVTDKVNDLGFATGVGLVKWGSVMQSNEQNKRYRGATGSRGIAKLSGNLKKWMRALIP